MVYHEHILTNIHKYVDWLFMIYVYYTCWHILVTCIWPDGILQVSDFQPGKWRHTSYETIAPIAISYWNVIVQSHVFNMFVTYLPMHYVFMLENVWKYMMFILCPNVNIFQSYNPRTRHYLPCEISYHLFFHWRGLADRQIAWACRVALLNCKKILWAIIQR